MRIYIYIHIYIHVHLFGGWVGWWFTQTRVNTYNFLKIVIRPSRWKCMDLLQDGARQQYTKIKQHRSIGTQDNLTNMTRVTFINNLCTRIREQATQLGDTCQIKLKRTLHN